MAASHVESLTIGIGMAFLALPEVAGTPLTDIAIVLLVVVAFIALCFYARACRALTRSLDGERQI